MSPESNASLPDHEFSELLNLGFAANPLAVSAIADAIESTLIQAHVPEQKRMEIGLAVQEALANAAVHGCKNDCSKEVRCRLEMDPRGRVLIIVADPGPGFNPDVLADPIHPDNILADHGRGVYLIRKLMDEVQFEMGGKQIRMLKY
jgi:serine/threonine-protein kinase RsbW